MTQAGGHVLIAGGGIGGLAAAIALRRAGVNCTVFEKETAPSEGGSALTLWSNAVRALDALGLGESVRAEGVPVQSGEIRDVRGRLLFRVPVAEYSRRAGAPSICLTRSALHGALLAALPADSVSTSSSVTGFDTNSGGVTVQLLDGSRASGELLVGADGISSAVRSQLHGESTPRYAGQVCFRATIDWETEDTRAGHSFQTWHGGHSFGVVPMGSGRVYWFANLTAPAGTRFADAATELMGVYGSWHAPIPSILKATPSGEIICRPVLDRHPVRQWGSGPVTLLGDAAHPSTPDMGQGACMALEDAVVLGRCVAAHGTTAAALRVYERVRMKRTAWVTRRSRSFGWMGHLAKPWVCGLRNAVIRATPAFITSRDFVHAIGHDAATVPLAEIR